VVCVVVEIGDDEFFVVEFCEVGELFVMFYVNECSEYGDVGGVI